MTVDDDSDIDLSKIDSADTYSVFLNVTLLSLLLVP